VPYFFIVPAFVLWFVALSAASVASYLLPSLKPWRSHCVGVLLWSTIGFVLSTALYAVAAVALFGGLGKLFDGEPSAAGGIAMGLMIFVVPFVAAAVGVFGGVAFGWRRAQRKARA
jgi:hypothetical protein